MSIQKKFLVPETYTTESGFVFKEFELSYHSWGTLNKERDNVILIFHALTGDSNAEDWFHGFFTQKSPIDLDRHYVLCINTPGSCYGSTGPQSLNPQTQRAYGPSFPVLTIRDIVQMELYLINHLNITAIQCVIGGSMGGMIALEFALIDPRIKRAFLMAMGKAHTAWSIGLSHLQRKAIYQDTNWNGGWYSDEAPPSQGLSLARQIGMMTYRSPQDYEAKFSRDIRKITEYPYYEVESYLDYQGEKLDKRFDALSYERLTRSMDTHDISRGHGNFKEVASLVTIPIHIVGIQSDALYPIAEQKELAQLLPNAEFTTIKSRYGHDAFLIEFEQLTKILALFLANS